MAPSPVAHKRTIPVSVWIVGAVVLAFLGAAGIYLSRPVPPAQQSPPSTRARAYLQHLALSEVTMQATENFMKQQILEIKGKITDNGPDSLNSVDVWCLFYGVDGREVHRERLPVVARTTAPLKSGETRAFRLPVDPIPEGWNQAMPKMVIAAIDFAQPTSGG